MHWLYSLHSTSFPQTRDCIDWERHLSGSCPVHSKVIKREKGRKQYSLPSLEYIQKKWAETRLQQCFGMHLTATSENKASPATLCPPFPSPKSKTLHKCNTTSGVLKKSSSYKSGPFLFSSFISPYSRTVPPSSSSLCSTQGSSTEPSESLIPEA